MSSSTTKTVVLKTSDGEIFEVPEDVALMSETIKHAIEDDCTDNGIPLANVTSSILAKVIEYCKKHVGVEEPSAEFKAFDAEFVKEADRTTLFDIILAANYLNVKGLLDLTCQAVADSIKDLSPEEVRKIFNITNDFTPEEEAKVREENKWAFE